jgi:autotransporter-associated beta strand protein
VLWVEVLEDRLNPSAPHIVSLTPDIVSSGTLAASATSLQITFDQAVVGANVAANYQLHGAGSDGLLGTVDDTTITLAASAPTSSSAQLTFSALSADVYRLTVTGSGITSSADGTPLDGAGNGTPGSNYVRDFVAITTPPYPLTSPGGFTFDPAFAGFGAGQLVQGTNNAFDGLGRLQVDGVDYAPAPATTPALSTTVQTTSTQYTTSSPTFQDIDSANLSSTITLSAAGQVRLDAGLTIQADTTSITKAALRFTVDGSPLSEQRTFQVSPGGTAVNFEDYATLAAGQHVIRVQWANPTSNTIYVMPAPANTLSFAVTQVNTIPGVGPAAVTTVQATGTQYTTSSPTFQDIGAANLSSTITLSAAGQVRFGGGLTIQADTTGITKAALRFTVDGNPLPEQRTFQVTTGGTAVNFEDYATLPAGQHVIRLQWANPTNNTIYAMPAPANTLLFAVTQFNTIPGVGPAAVTTVQATGTQYTTSSPAFQDIDSANLSSTINLSAAGQVRLDAGLTIQADTTGITKAALRFTVDGNPLPEQRTFQVSPGGTAINFEDYATLPAGQHVIRVQWANPTSNTIYAMPAPANTLLFAVTQVNGLSGPNLANGGLTVVTPSQTMSGLDVHREVTMPNTGSQDFARTVEVFANLTGSPITATVHIAGNLGSDAATQVFATSDGDTTVGTTDQWVGTDDADGSGTPAIIHFIHGPAGLQPSAVQVSGDNIDWTYSLTVQPGQTVRLAEFTILNSTRSGAIAAANALVTDSGFGGQAAAFLSAADLASLANFQFPGPLTYNASANPAVGAYTLKRNGSTLQIVETANPNNILASQAYSSTTVVTITGQDNVNDTLTVDFSGGNPIPAGGVSFAGGAGGNDMLAVGGGSGFTSLRYDATGPGAGTLTFNGSSLIAFTGLEQMTVTPAAGTTTVAISDGQPHTATFTAGPGAGMNTVAIDGGLESMTFANPTTQLTAIADAGSDTFTFTSLDSGFGAALSVQGSTGSGDTVNLNTSLHLLGALAIDSAVETTNLGASSLVAGSVNVQSATTVVTAPSVTINTSAANGNIAFSNSINDANATSTNALSLNAGSGAVSLPTVGSTRPLASLSVTTTGPGTTLNGNVSADSIVLSGNVTLAVPVTLAHTGVSSLNISGGTISLGSNTLTDSTLAATDSGTIASGLTGSGGLNRTGPGALTLSGTGTCTGSTQISAGTLLVNGTLANTAGVMVNGSGVLGGSGSINSSAGVTVSGGGQVAPGSSPGILSTGPVAFSSGSIFAVDLGGTTAGTGYDQLNVTGTVSLGGATLSASTFGGFTPSNAVQQIYRIINNDLTDSISGTFAGLPEGSAVTVSGSPIPLYITYTGGDGNDVDLTTQPVVPGTAGNDSLVLRRSTTPGMLEFSLNGSPFVQVSDSVPFTFNAGGGDDTMILDLRNGNVDAAGGILFNGGSNATSRGDVLVIQGSGSESASYTPSTTAGSGSVTITAGASTATINFTSGEAIDATALSTITMTPGSVTNVLGVANGSNFGGLSATTVSPFTSAANTSALVFSGSTGGTTFAPLAAWNDAAAGCAGGTAADTVTISSASAGSDTNLSISTGSVTVASGAAINLAGSLTLTAAAINLNTAMTITTGTTQSYAGPVNLGTNATLSSTGSGNITFGSTMTGTGADLVIDTQGTTGFNGNVSVKSLTTDAGGSTAFGSGVSSVSSVNAQTYGDSMVLGADAILTAGAPSSMAAVSTNGHMLTIASNATWNTSGAISGAGGLVKNGSGTLTLSAANTYSGAITINAGTLALAGSLLGSGSSITLAGNSVLFTGSTTGVVANRAVLLNGSSDTVQNFAGLTALGGTAVTVNGPSALIQNSTISNSNIGVLLSSTGSATLAVNTFSGDTTAIDVAGGLLSLSMGNRMAGSTVDLLVDGSTAKLAGLTVSKTDFGAVPAGGYFIKLVNQAHIGPDLIDATSSRFDVGSGLKPAASMTPAELNTLEQKLRHYADDPTVGLIVPRFRSAAVEPSTGNLIVYGSNVADTITLNTTTPSAVTVTISGTTFTFNTSGLSSGRVIVFAMAGNDVVQVTGNQAAELHGGPGDDSLSGGGGDDVLYGEDGNDTLSGGAGNDVLIGGAGMDNLSGGTGQDILIGSALSSLFTYDQVDAARQDWVLNSNEFSPMINALYGAVIQHPNLAGEQDTLSGGDGADLFIFQQSPGPGMDLVTDFLAGTDRKRTW